MRIAQRKHEKQKPDVKFECGCFIDQNLQCDALGTSLQFETKAVQSFATIIKDFLGFIISRALRVNSCLNILKARIAVAKFSWKAIGDIAA